MLVLFSVYKLVCQLVYILWYLFPLSHSSLHSQHTLHAYSAQFQLFWPVLTKFKPYICLKASLYLCRIIHMIDQRIQLANKKRQKPLIKRPRSPFPLCMSSSMFLGGALNSGYWKILIAFKGIIEKNNLYIITSYKYMKCNSPSYGTNIFFFLYVF